MSTIEQIKNSLGRYYLAMNPGYKYVPFQQEKIAPALEKLEKREIRRLMINMGPGHAKSDWSTRNFVPFYMGRHPDHNAIVISYSADLASDDFGAKIKRRMEDPLHLRIFPDSKLTRDSRSKTHFTTIKGGSFYSTGVGGSITGKRLNLGVLDDLINSFQEADSETIQGQLFEHYKGAIKDRMRPDGVILICAHRWRRRDIYGRILEFEGTVEDGGSWTVLKLPAEDPPDSGQFLWEEYYGRDYYADFKRDSEVWWSKFQQDPTKGEGQSWFDENDLEFYDIAPPIGKFKYYLFCDPGASKDRKSDRTSIQVYAAAQDQRLILVEWVLDKLDPLERQKKLEGILRRYRPELALYEEYGLVNDSVYFNQRAEEIGLDAILTPVGKKGPRHNLAKQDRIRELKPWIKGRQIVLPRKYIRKIHSGQNVDLTKRFIEEEFKLYSGDGSIAHEDDLDCMSRINDVMPPFGPGFEWYEAEPEITERSTRGGLGSSWESTY